MTVKSVNSLERLQAVLEVFSEDRLEWTPEEMMEVLGYARPTLYRYLKISQGGRTFDLHAKYRLYAGAEDRRT